MRKLKQQNLKPSQQPINVPKRHGAVVYIHDPVDLLLLLKTTEIKTLLQSLGFLYESVVKTPEVGRDLVERGLIELVLSLPTFSHPLYNAERYRLLSKLYTLFPQERDRFRENRTFLFNAMEDAMSTHDTALRAYALQFLSLLTENIQDELNEFSEKYDLNKIFTMFLCDPDVDVQNNSLALLKNLLSYPETKIKIPELREFRFRPLFPQVGCPYPDIQNKALDVILSLVSFEGDKREVLQTQFTNTGGLDLLITVLFVFHWRDLHPKCLEILCHLAESTSQILNLEAVNGIQKLVKYIIFIEDDSLQAMDLDVLMKIGRIAEGRLVLSRSGAMQILNKLLLVGNHSTKEKALETIRVLCVQPSDLTELTKNDPVPILLDILQNKENELDLRCKTAITLSTLVNNVPQSVLTLSNPKKFFILQKILNSTYPLDETYLTPILEAMLTVLSYPTHLNNLINRKLTRKLLFLQHSKSTSLGKIALKILSYTLKREKGRELFLNNRGITAVMKALYKESDSELVESFGLLLKAAFKDNILTQCFLTAGISSWFSWSLEKFGDYELLRSAWATLMQADLSLKFQATQRLDLFEVTKDGFYVFRSPTCCCGRDAAAVINLLSSDEEWTTRPVYYANMGLDSKPLNSKEDSISLFSFDPASEPEEIFTQMSSRSFISSLEEIDISSLNLPSDNRLREIYETIKFEMNERSIPSSILAGKKRFQREWVEAMAGILGRTVAAAMDGRAAGLECNNHTFELYLQELKEELGGRLTPIGALEVGLKLERAILFKVLADRLGLPCALARDHMSNGWVEVAIAEIADNIRDVAPRTLQANYAVDLMDRPGHLIPLQSLGKPQKHRLLKNASFPDNLKSCKRKQLHHVELE